MFVIKMVMKITLSNWFSPHGLLIKPCRANSSIIAIMTAVVPGRGYTRSLWKSPKVLRILMFKIFGLQENMLSWQSMSRFSIDSSISFFFLIFLDICFIYFSNVIPFQGYIEFRDGIDNYNQWSEHILWTLFSIDFQRHFSIIKFWWLPGKYRILCILGYLYTSNLCTVN